ncbi:MAG: chain length determinant protein EpsF [Methylococcales bacterium]
MNFQQLIIILWSRRWIALLSLLLTVSTALVISLILPKQYSATASLVIDQRGVDPLTGLTLPVQLIPGYMATQVDIITSHNVARKVVRKLKLTDIAEIREEFEESENTGDIGDWVADLLLENLEVTPSRESSLITVSFTSTEPRFATATANEFAEAYIQTNIELRAQPAKLNADWFDNQIEALRERLEKTQSVLSSYQQEQGIVAVDERLDLENARLVDLSRQLVESQVRTNELVSHQQPLKSSPRGRNGVSSQSLQDVLANPLIQNLKAELARAEGKFAELSKRVGKNHPEYLQTQALVFNLRSKLDSEIRTVMESLSGSIAASRQRDEVLAANLAAQKAKVLELKKQRDAIAVLNREVENAQHAYDNFMQRSIQTRMESELSNTNIAVLNPAIPPQEPATPNLLLNMILSVFLGSLLGVGTALMAELFDRRVRAPFDIAEALELPVLSVISANRNSKSVTIFHRVGA